MQIWSAEIKELETLYTSIKGRFPELEKELVQLIETKDANVVLLYSRRCLEVIISDLCESELRRPRKTEPLKGIIDKLHHEEKIPSYIITSMQNLNSLSTYGTHPKEFDPEQVKPVLNNLTTIIKWYLKYKDTRSISKSAAAAAETVAVAEADEAGRYENEVRTDSTERFRKPKKKLIFFLSGLALVVVIIVVVLFVFNIIDGKKQTEELEKSIAVLPFKLLSDEPDKQYLADGMMDAILLHLSKIQDLRVMSRTSTEQYRVPGKTMTEIGRELGVEYLLEGSFQKYGDDVRLIVQLIQTGKEGHKWANEYDRKWNDILSVQREVAQTIARELHAVITPQEQEIIEKIPTADLNAYDLYLKANDYRQDYSHTRNFNSYQKAVSLYMASIDIDSAFAKAYTGLAIAYWSRYYWESYFRENFMDSCLVLANKALSIDDQLDEAYLIKGDYYWVNGQIEKSLDNFDKALKINPNFYGAYYYKGYILTLIIHDFVNGLDSYHKGLNLIHGNERPSLLRNLGDAYWNVGFMDKSKYFYQEALTLDGDSARYLRVLCYIEFSLGNTEEALRLAKKINEIDSTILMDIYMYSIPPGHEEEAYVYANRVLERHKRSGALNLQQSHRIGYAYWKVGKYEEAKYFFNEQIRYGTESIKLSRDIASWKAAQYDLAAAYAFLGDKEKAYQYLDEFNEMNFFPIWWISLAKHDPLLDSIRNEERFQMILQNMEAKYQAEHERVKKWLEEQGDLPG